MCLAVPGKILGIHYEGDLPMGEVDFSGVRKQVCLVYTPEARIGDYVVAHVGFSISILNEIQSQRTLELINEIRG